MPSRSFHLAAVAFALFLLGGAPPAAQEMHDNESFLVGALFKTWTLKERALADIQMSDRELQTSETRFQEAENRMTIAIETYNDQAIFAAREPLRQARADLKKLKQTRARLDLARTSAEASYAAVRNLLVSGQGKGSKSLIRGLVSLQSGKAEIFRKSGKKVALGGSHPGFLEPGDEVMTTRASSAEVQVLDGRASVRLGEHSRLKLEEDGPQEQALRLVQGKIHSAVDNVADFADRLEDNAGHFEADQDLKKAIARTHERMKQGAIKKFTVRTSSACCFVSSTQFTLELMGGDGAEIAVLEGAVEVGDAKCAPQVLVGQGFKVTVTKEGISEPREVADIDHWWEK